MLWLKKGGMHRVLEDKIWEVLTRVGDKIGSYLIGEGVLRSMYRDKGVTDKILSM